MTLEHEAVLDKNGNPLKIHYPGDLTATYQYDYLNRNKKLTRKVGTGSETGTVEASSNRMYNPLGPVYEVRVRFSGSAVRDFRWDWDFRDAPVRLRVAPGTVPPFLDWNYSTDGVGNVTQIAQAQPTPAVNRIFGYQDWQYFLSYADGPWSGPLEWSYDRSGNRLTESRGHQPQSLYTYAPNSASGNTSVLQSITGGLTSLYEFDVVGNLDSKDADGNLIDFVFDEANLLGRVSRQVSDAMVFTHDARGFLELSQTAKNFPPYPPGEAWVESVYDSSGRLMSLLRHPVAGLGDERINVLYFAGRPIALWRRIGTATPTITYLMTDHLGTPIQSLIASTGPDWTGGFEPFGRDYQEGTSQDAFTKGIFLRLPGQWDDPLWSDATLGADVYYNVHRWYESGTGRFASTDPIGLQGGPHLYLYAASNPLAYIDPTGLQLVVPPDVPFIPDPSDRPPADCSAGPWRFLRFIYRDKGVEELWQLVATHPIKFAWPNQPRGAGSFELGCVCEYALRGIFKVTEQWSEWRQTISCPPCEKYERTRYRFEGEFRQPLPFIAPSWPKRTLTRSNCILCPPTMN